MTRRAPIGKALRRLRQQNDWTLADVAERTGLAVSTLSKVENDRMSLTFDKIVSLCEGLGVDIGTLFTGDAPQAGEADASAAPVAMMTRRSVDKGSGDDALVPTKNYRHRYLNTDITHKKMIPILVEHRARTMEEFGALVRHPGEEFVYVMEGAIELHTEFYAPTLVKAGESIYLDSTMGHAYLAASDGPCRTLSVCSSPETALAKALMVNEPTVTLKKPVKE
ncbi:helix-turn-helix domain-containing protein [Niveispirillum sp. KHB5.9]|uniref:helix-turn-helix domain-containing protein n=1 Tax=Niveispirillum sp. KHB5.9 TaxID=3400269 RepID=UPI003A89CCF3